MSETVTIQIGNTDDKLTQSHWSAFVKKCDSLICRRARQVHFSGFSNPSEVWQNSAWVFEISGGESARLWDEMKQLAQEFNQDSIAWTEGKTLFVEAAK